MKKQRKPFGDIPRILSHIAPWWLRYAVGMVGDSANNLIFGYLAGFLLGNMTEAGKAGDMAILLRKLPYYAALLLGCALVLGFARYLRESSVELGDAALRRALLHHMMRVSLKSHRKSHSGNWIAVLVSDAGNAMKACDQALYLAMTVLVSSVGSVVYIFTRSTAMGWATLGVALMSLVFNGAFAPWLRRMNQSKRQAIGGMTERLTDMLAGHTTIRTNGLQDFFRRRYLDALENMFHWSRKISWFSIITSTPAELSRFLIDGGVMAAGVLLLNAGKLSANELMICWSLGTGVAFTMRRLGRSYVDLQARLASADRVAWVLDEPKVTYGDEDLPAEGGKAVEFGGVRFAYDETKTLFDGMNLTIDQGERVGFVGSSGGGKSTAVSLLLRFYDADSGVVRAFGRDVREYSKAALNGLFAYVPQAPYLFDATIYDNIAFGRPGASREDVLDAARRAYVDEFVQTLPDGYNTRVGERGVQLSGGQRQRIAIARAFLKDAPILILDEATASLGSHSEAQVQSDVLDQWARSKTVIVVAHRLSTTVSANTLFVMDEGRIVESGTHEELLAKDGAYALLWNTQSHAATQVIS